MRHMKFTERLQKLIATRRKDDENGFTLMEMLIVVAIIAVLIAIAIPIFTSQLENSREATDAANIRSGYAVASAKVLTDGGTTGVSAGPIELKQTQENWTSQVGSQKIGDFTLSGAPSSGSVHVNVAPDGTTTVSESATAGYTVVDPVNGTAEASSNNGGGNGNG